MANAIYYGICKTASSSATKQVVLTDSNFESFKPGDILSVYFTQANTATAPTLVLYIDDINNEYSIGSDTGLDIYEGSVHAGPGAWAAAEVVNFSYTRNRNITENADNTAFWEITSKSKATATSYGVVTIDGDNNNSAVSLNKVRTLLTQGGIFSYNSNINNGIAIGTLNFTDFEGNTNSTIVQIPEPSSLPSNINLADYDNTYSQFITNTLDGDLNFNGDSKKIKIEADGSYIPVIDLSNDTNSIEVTSQGDILLIPEDTCSVILGDSDTNTDTYVQNDLYILDTLHGNNGSFETLNVENLTATMLNGDIDSANTTIDSVSLNDYLATQITASSNIHKTNIYASPNIKWKWHTSGKFSLAPGKYKPDILVGDFAEEGYRVIGIISWESFHDKESNGTSPWLVNVYGFYWELSSISNKNDVLYAKAYNCGTSTVTNNKITACVLLMKDPMNVVIP